jgi:hypothetical protein
MLGDYLFCDRQDSLVDLRDAGRPTICGTRGSILLLQGVSEGTYLCSISSLVSLIISRYSLAGASNLDVGPEYINTVVNDMQLTFEVTQIVE